MLNNADQVRGKYISPAMEKLRISLSNSADTLETILYDVRGFIYQDSKPIIGIPHGVQNYWDWAKEKPSRYGYTFDKRFDFWAESKKGLEGVSFVTQDGSLVIPVYRDGDIANGIELSTGNFVSIDITKLMPLFPKAVLKHLKGKDIARFNSFQDLVADFCAARECWSLGTSRPAGSQLGTNSWSNVTGARPAYKKQERPNDLRVKNDPSKYFVTSTPSSDSLRNLGEAFKNASISVATIKASTINPKEEKETMTKTAQVKTGMIETNKEAMKQVGYLNAGRASNKLIKESVRPLLNVMFKPTFMQKIAMKLFKMENPVDVALKSGISDLVCAQLVQAIIEVKGVENEYVREVTQAGIVQAGYELSKAIPFEDAIDSVVKNLEKGAGDIVKKLK